MTHILAIVALLLAPLTTSQAAELPKPLDKPNVVLFLVDDLGYGDVACHGNLHVKTPQIDAFACQAAPETDIGMSRFDPVIRSPRRELTTRANLRRRVPGEIGKILVSWPRARTYRQYEPHVRSAVPSVGRRVPFARCVQRLDPARRELENHRDSFAGHFADKMPLVIARRAEIPVP